MKCKPGDMAVVLSAFHPSNVGRFVSVVRLYDNTVCANLDCESPVWLVESNAPLTWTRGKSLWLGNQGPVPDAVLQPIRGVSTGNTQATCGPKQKDVGNSSEITGPFRS